MTHTGDKVCYTAEVFIVYEDKVLLRMHEKYGIWLSVGGHIEQGEDPNQAALREVKEEVGIDVVLWDGNKEFRVNEESFYNIIPPVGLNTHTTNDAHEHITFVYFAHSTTDAVVPEDKDDQWLWASREDVLSMDLKENIREYALGALKTLGSI